MSQPWFLSRGLASVASAINPWRSLKARLGLAIGGSTFALSLLAGLAIGHTVKIREEASIGHSLAKLAYQMADKLDRGMFERYRDIQILSSLDPVRTAGDPSGTRRALLEKLQATYPDYAWIGLTNAQGRVLASTGALLEGQNVSKRPWFSGAQVGPYVGDVHEAKLLAKLLPNPSQEPLRFVDVAVPVTNAQGRFAGVLGAHLSWTWAREIQRSLLGPSEQQSQVEVLVLNQAGQVLLGAPELQPGKLTSFQAALASQNSYRVEVWPDGQAYLTGFARSRGYRNYPGLGWTVLVRQPTQIAFAPVRALQLQIFTGTVGLGILFAGLGWLLAGRLADPMLVIAAAADRIRQGQTEVKIPRLQGTDELARLSASLSRLVETLTRQEAELRLELEERQRAEAALRNSMEEVAELQRLGQIKDDFVSTVSHELRSPMASVKMAISMLATALAKTGVAVSQTANPDSAPCKTARYLQILQDECEREINLLNDLLDLQRLDSGIQPLSLDTILTSDWLVWIAEPFQARTNNRQQRLHVSLAPELPTMTSDSAYLGRILTELLNNACKYTPPGGQITLSARAQGSRMQIRVSNTGIEIPPEELPRIFDKFYRVSGGDPWHQGGTGLGLSLVQKLARHLQGSIEVESSFGQTNFTVELPLTIEGAAPSS